MASPVATFSSFWLRTMTSIRTQREFAVACFDFTMPVGWMVSPGRTKPSIRKATVAKEPDRRGEHEGNR